MLKLMKPDLLVRLMNGNTIWNAEVNNNPQSKVGPGKYDLSNCPYQCCFPLLFTLATTLECIAFSFCLKKIPEGHVLVVAGPYIGLDRHKFFCLLVAFLLFFSAVFVPQISIPGGQSVTSLVGRLYPVAIYMYGVKVPCQSRPGFFQIFGAGGKETSACNSLYTDVVLFFFWFFSKTSTSARKKSEERLFSFSLTPIPTR